MFANFLAFSCIFSENDSKFAVKQRSHLKCLGFVPCRDVKVDLKADVVKTVNSPNRVKHFAVKKEEQAESIRREPATEKNVLQIVLQNVQRRSARLLV